MTPQEIFDKLSAPFPTALINWRVGPTNERWRKEGDQLRGQPLCYIDARAVMDRLDSVCGPANWCCNYTPGVGSSIVCNIGLFFPVMAADQQVGHQWIFKADGAGATDMEADKGALSDAFKRSAVRWGIGRYLYDIEAPWIVLEQRGKSGVIPQAAHEDLRRLYNNFARSLMLQGETA
jgi:hypothetical protein